MDLPKRRLLLPLCIMLTFSISVFAQDASSGWKIKLEPAKAYIENKGQFRNPEVDGTILYAYDASPCQIFFTESGTAYSFTTVTHKKKDKGRKEKYKTTEEFLMAEKDARYKIFNGDFAAFKWEGGNLGVEVIPSEKRPDHFSYTQKNDDGTVTNTNFIAGYNKITYKNIYPGIDVEYSFHEVSGIKYAIFVHPGADVSMIKMKFTEQPVLDKEGNLLISTIYGDIIDHAPVTYYQGNPASKVSSNYVITGNTVTFNIGQYDHNQTLVIDPWVQTPTIANSNSVWECERDAAGNVYITGGESPLQLLKYSAAGSLLWTYVTPYDTVGGDWLGTFVTDLAGNSYVTNGSNAQLEKINTSGGLT